MNIALFDLARVRTRAVGLFLTASALASVPPPSLAQASESSSGPMFPTPFTRVVEMRLLVDGELDHRWSVRESYWDHWLILESWPGSDTVFGSGTVPDGSGRKTVSEVADQVREDGAPPSGRRRLINLETGDLIEIDWDAGTFWRSTSSRQRALVRRLEEAEGWRTDAPSPSVPEQNDLSDAARRKTRGPAVEASSDRATAVVEDALARLRADRRLLSRSVTQQRRTNSSGRSVEVRAEAMVLRPADVIDATAVAGAGADRHSDDWASAMASVVEARVWSDERIVLTEAALLALEEQEDSAGMTVGLITLSPIAARARSAASGALPLAARATVRIPGLRGRNQLAMLSEITVRLDPLVGGDRFVRIPASLREVAPPLEAVVKRAELERRLDQGMRP